MLQWSLASSLASSPERTLTDSFGKETVSCILLPSNFFFGGGGEWVVGGGDW